MKTKESLRQGSDHLVISSTNNGLLSSQLMILFEDELKDIYWAEKKLTNAIPKMIKNATSEQLIEALENHLSQTEKQVTRIEQVFEIFGKKANSKKCEAIDRLIREGREIMEDCEEGPMCDAGIISVAQKIEHYEIASYGTLRQFAKTLGLTDAASLLEQTLCEEKAADEKLSEIAGNAINIQVEVEDREESIYR